MVKCEDLKNYISSSRHLGIAMAFANASDAWVYVLRIRGGFNLRGSHRYNTKPNEQEIAFPGSVPWDEVFAFRRATQGKGRGLLTGPVYMRKVFEAVNPAAYKEVFEILSGKPQKPA